MRRKAFDKILTALGIALTVMLVAAGGLLTWGHSFANNAVSDQLVAQKIFFPPAGAAYEPQNEIGRYLAKYAGQQLTTGVQARDYANHFIAVHLKESAGGMTYAEASTKARTDPKNTELQGQVATLFKGETLRGMLLNAYGWWQMGQLALWGAIVSYALAAVMLVLSILGLFHLRQVPAEAEIFAATSKKI